MYNMRTTIITTLVSGLALIALLTGCKHCSPAPHEFTKEERMQDDVPTSGFIYIAADEAYRYIIEEEVDMFQFIYPHAIIKVLYSDEKTAFENAMNDSVRLVIASTPDHNAFDEYLLNKTTKKRVVAVGKDAVVLIANKELPVKGLQQQQLKDILSGKIRRWKEIDPSAPDQSIQVYFDSQRSGIARYLTQELMKGSGALHGTATDSTMQVVASVEKDVYAIGFVGYNYFSNRHDSRTKDLASRVKKLALSTSGDSTGFFLPSQTTLADSTYPLTRRMLIINKEGKTGLGTGFVSFVAGPKGQKILLKAGMVPERIPERNIEIVHN